MFATAAIDPLTAPQPVLALLFHQARDRLLVTRHPLEATLQGSLIGAGAPFSASDLEQLDDLLHARQRPPPTLLPPTVLALERDLLLWRLPAAVRPLYLRQGERTLSLMVPWPPLLLAARERTLYVVALRGGCRPTARTPLYHAPLMNVHATGQVCTGNADLPAETTLATLAAWQAVLTDTWFTHVNHPNTLRLPDSTGTAVDTRRHLRFWRDLAKRRAERFPVACLTPLGLTLEGFLRRLTRS